MSLFPAYSESNVESKDESKNPEAWTVNSSFAGIIPPQNIQDDNSSSLLSSDKNCKTEDSNRSLHETHETCSKPISVKRIRKRSQISSTKKYIKEQKKYKQNVKNVYFEDTKRNVANNHIKTISCKERPYYKISYKTMGCTIFKKFPKKKTNRYYVVNLDTLNKSKKKFHKEKNKINEEGDNDFSWGTKIEEEWVKKTKEYNQRLAENPENIDLWIEYINFQDINVGFRCKLKENTKACNFQRKLSIVEKALESNVNNTELLKLKYKFMSDLMPADQFSNDLEAWVNKDPGDILLWRTYIMATQGSLSMCTVPKVLDLYKKYFSTLKQYSRGNTQEHDDKLLGMLFRCLIFLRQAGLWEQMWEIIRVNLTLNLSLEKDQLWFKSSMDEKKLISMEEVILMSRLPLNQLWLRTELLRENSHWISVSENELELVGDSHRFILPEDVADFVHPLISLRSNFRLAIYSLLSLKIPLLPTRDCAMQSLGLKEFEWSLDSAEVLLPFAYPVVGEMADRDSRKELLEGILEGGLTSGPQYLRFHPAQEPYLEFIRNVFHVIADNLSGLERTSIYVWWLRFERMLLFLNPKDKGKKLRNMIKEFLKKEENRNNLYFYKEYALIEKELGRHENCVNILKTAIQLQNSSPASVTDFDDRAALFSLYRTFFETLLDTDVYKEIDKPLIMSVFRQMIAGEAENQLELVEKYLYNCLITFLREIETEEANDVIFLSNIKSDMIACYIYFLYIKGYDLTNLTNIYDDCIYHSTENRRLQELLYEDKLALVQMHSERTNESRHILKEVFWKILCLYPNNIYALSVFSTSKSSMVPSWKFKTGDKTELWPTIGTFLAGRRRIKQLVQSGAVDTAGVQATLNKLLSFHRSLSKSSESTCCPLLWRMYMLLLREHNLCEKKGEEVYHESVAHCPWARSIYIDAAEVAPQLLTQIQDVIKEKELRLHVTPEELDILRQ
ncbi:nuclear exosome regulator NRDE2 [Prorops nasuta]|uniref:nuclear exosome regulator NRDE2 n=1 Tax=Prorops nasuta TaxID=863751 RepID=UPI0034CDE67B